MYLAKSGSRRKGEVLAFLSTLCESQRYIHRATIEKVGVSYAFFVFSFLGLRNAFARIRFRVTDMLLSFIAGMFFCSLLGFFVGVLCLGFVCFNKS